MSDIQNRGPVYTAAFASTDLAASAHDVLGLLAPANSRVRIDEIVLTLPSSDATNVGVQLLRGSTASSTGATITPRHIHGWSDLSAGSSVTGPSATLVSTASAVAIYSDGTSQLRWAYKPAPDDRPIINMGQRLHVRISALSTGLRLNGAITFSEIGRPAST